MRSNTDYGELNIYMWNKRRHEKIISRKLDRKWQGRLLITPVVLVALNYSRNDIYMTMALPSTTTNEACAADDEMNEGDAELLTVLELLIPYAKAPLLPISHTFVFGVGYTRNRIEIFDSLNVYSLAG
jgi:hypothetical protein